MFFYQNVNRRQSPRPFYPLYPYSGYSPYWNYNAWMSPYGGFYPYYQLGTSYHTLSGEFNGGLPGTFFVPLGRF